MPLDRPAPPRPALGAAGSAEEISGRHLDGVNAPRGRVPRRSWDHGYPPGQVGLAWASL